MKKIHFSLWTSAIFITILLSFNCYASEAVYGDADNDGIVTATDAVLVLNKINNPNYRLPIENNTFRYRYYKYIDLNADCRINDKDLELIMKKVFTPDIVTNSQTIDSTGVIVSDFNSLVNAVKSVENNGGGTVYIASDYIECTSNIALKNDNANVVISAYPGYTPVLDFSVHAKPYVWRNKDYIGTEVNFKSSWAGFNISGSGYTIKNIIVEKAAHNGIRLAGERCQNNIIENVVTRYNNNSGLEITNSASNNTIRYVDSYRNCDVNRLGSDADGFALKVNCGSGNKFYNCRAWENADDGWDSYMNYNDAYYENCVCWHNGDFDVFTGKYDFENNNDLDENMLLIQLIMEEDNNFKNNYENGILKFPETDFFYATADKVNLELFSLAYFESHWGGNPNGFKFGSGISSTHNNAPATGTDAKRYVKNCIAFDHEGKGFDQNNSSCSLELENTVAFGNLKYNYMVQNMNVLTFTNAISFSGSDKLASGTALKTISSKRQAEIKNRVYEIRDEIIKKVYNNEIPGEVEFDVFN